MDGEQLNSNDIPFDPGPNFIKHVSSRFVLTERPLAEFLFQKAVYQKQA